MYGCITSITTLYFIIGFILVPAVTIGAFVFAIVVAIKAFGDEEQYRNPVNDCSWKIRIMNVDSSCFTEVFLNVSWEIHV